MLRRFLLVAALGLLVSGAATSLAVFDSAQPGEASSHREAPLISSDPLGDNTDVYAFVSPDAPSTVTLISDWIPMEEPAGGPNFNKFGDFPQYAYDFYIDNNGDAKPDITYEFRFHTEVQNENTFLYATEPITSLTDPDFNVRQYYDVIKIVGAVQSQIGHHLPTPPVNIGPVSTPNYGDLATAAVQQLGPDSKVFAGQRDDPFFVDLGAIFDLATVRHLPGNAGGGKDGLGGYNTHTIALQLPKTDLVRSNCDTSNAADMNCVLGVWSTTQEPSSTILRTDGGAPHAIGRMVQVSRLGNPLVNEVVIPRGKKDKFNASDPRDDAQFLHFVTNPELAADLNLLYSVGAPTQNRQDLVAVFLTGIPGLNKPNNVRPAEELRLNVAIPPAATENRFGVVGGDVAGFPNGRRLGDDVTDIELRAVCGVTYAIFVDTTFAPNAVCGGLGDGVDKNDVNGGTFMSSFPYVQTPHQGFEHTHDVSQAISGAQGIALGLGGASLLLGFGLVVPGLIKRRRIW